MANNRSINGIRSTYKVYTNNTPSGLAEHCVSTNNPTPSAPSPRGHA